ncbi:N-acetylmuramoyl-L-alanine amidase [Spirulina sp. CCNP1310]|uniref:N-acetylmuramoyl-L-alanine amidase n=1 Tax=Spirulina sp. CCNP1310 TaxID=3110249 RepID=UPI002B20CEDB|nr:N-acetylmuramoyl-L-alanine amidase [Spirulina sp. CCNP1310]MEA5419796.1 N-acetylmuramoyl-L-alanine amidase [Spirulina sp. CCNP1310]
MQRFGFLFTVLSLCLWGIPAEAARLVFWQFDAAQNRLVFSTDEAVQPKARLLQNPTRLVIDLPGVDVAAVERQQWREGAIATIQAQVVDPQTSQLVVEMAPGYTLDPQQIRIAGQSPTEWQVELPQAVRSPLPSVANRPLPRLEAQANSTITAIEISGGNQLVIRGDRGITGTKQWSTVDRAYTITIPNARVDDAVAQSQLPVNSPVSQLRVRQRGSTVEIVVYPATNFQAGNLSQLNPTTLALRLEPQTSTNRPIRIPPTSQPPTTIGRPPTPQPNNSPLPQPTGRNLVALDPGHGGRDPGAIGIGGLREKDVILPISLEVARTLQQQGVQVMMTRSDDRFITLAARTQMANQARATIFVSIHANAISMSRPDVNGVETFYFSGQGQRLAQSIQSSILQSIPMRNRGVKQARFYVLRTSAMPSALVEVGFVTGAEDAPRLANPQFRSQMAQAISRGILLYLQQN